MDVCFDKIALRAVFVLTNGIGSQSTFSEVINYLIKHNSDSAIHYGPSLSVSDGNV